MSNGKDDLMEFLHRFENQENESTETPSLFNFPFYYKPRFWSEKAAAQLKSWLSSLSPIDPLDQSLQEIGKMFGVLVVKLPDHSIGYLQAFSGKLANSNYHRGFVPPIFDTLDPDGFYKRGEEEINQINAQIKALENDKAYTTLKEEKQKTYQDSLFLAEAMKTFHKRAKKHRDEIRKLLSPPEEHEMALSELARESAYHHFQAKDFKRYISEKMEQFEIAVRKKEKNIQILKDLRKQKSAELQQKLFEQYKFINKNGQSQDLIDIFGNEGDQKPPSGAGECAAPKLLQFAFKHGLDPICMTEFWWGKSPSSEIRTQGMHYPACRGKCEPILGHMLAGIPMEPNPMLDAPDGKTPIPILYEDEALLIIHKPHDYLSVPGKNIKESIYTRMLALFPHATGPLIVHRLDMSTSGLMVIAKTKQAYHHLQRQFISRRIKKTYMALLKGRYQGPRKGTIDLPLRVDLDDRPRQLVCYEYGKAAKTEFEITGEISDKTIVKFHPITGRTHQLRVHAAHPNGLGMPILGDDLYGERAQRLFLHATELSIIHPVTKEPMNFECPPKFEKFL